MEQQIVIFGLADEHYGVDINAVQAIIKMQPITKIPHAPSCVVGVTNLRGKVLPVMDLRQRFNLTAQKDTRDSRIVVVLLDSAEVGMVVDSVSEVLTLLETDIEPTPSMAVDIDSGFITGIARLDERLVILLDLAAVLSGEEKIEMQALLPVAV